MTQTLIERLREAEGGSRELDNLIAVHLGASILVGIPSKVFWPHKTEVQQGDDPNNLPDLPSYTTCLNAAIALVEEIYPSHDWSVTADGENRCYWATIGDDNWDESMSDFVGRSDHTPALALVVCLLKAWNGDKSDALLSAMETDGGEDA